MKACSVFGCPKVAAYKGYRGRVAAWFCHEHAEGVSVVALKEFEPVTTGSKDCDHEINTAVDVALLRIKPILRDFIRQELKRNLQACDLETQERSVE